MVDDLLRSVLAVFCLRGIAVGLLSRLCLKKLALKNSVESWSIPFESLENMSNAILSNCLDICVVEL